MPIEAIQDEGRNPHVARMRAVREAYWNHSIGLDDMPVLWDALVQVFGIDEPSMELQKKLFDLLPDQTIGLAITWGFNDTEVREDVMAFASDEADPLARELGLSRRGLAVP